MNRVKNLAAAVAGHAESVYWRLTYFMLYPAPRRFNGNERRGNPRACVLCGGPMRPDSRPPEEILAWFKCGRCYSSQVGITR